nr:hypothetical protein [Tanacetum cinerariifolium]
GVGLVAVGKGMFGLGFAIEVVFCLFCSKLISSMMVIRERFGVEGIGVGAVLLVLLLFGS